MSVNLKYRYYKTYTGYMFSTEHLVSMEEIPRWVANTRAWLSAIKNNMKSSKIWNADSKSFGYSIELEYKDQNEINPYAQAQYFKDPEPFIIGRCSTVRAKYVGPTRRDVIFAANNDAIKLAESYLESIPSALEQCDDFTIVSLDKLFTAEPTAALSGEIEARHIRYVINADICDHCGMLFFSEHERDFHHLYTIDYNRYRGYCMGISRMSTSIFEKENQFVSISALVDQYKLTDDELKLVIDRVKVTPEAGSFKVPIWVDALFKYKRELQLDVPTSHLFDIYEQSLNTTDQKVTEYHPTDVTPVSDKSDAES